MAKKKVDVKKAIKSTIIWTIVYFTVIVYYVKHDLGINLLSMDDIHSKYVGFVSGQWSMSRSGTLLFLSTIILFIPVWIVGSMMVYKIHWKIPKLFRRKEKAFKRDLMSSIKKDGRIKIPVKLKLQAYGHSSFAPTSNTADDLAPTTHAVLSTVEKQDELISIQNDLQTLMSQYQADVFPNIDLGGIWVPLALSTEDETAYLFSIVHEPNGHFIVDIKDNLAEGINADWFSTLSPIPSPAKHIKEAADKLKEMETDSEIIPVIVITAGELEDAKSVLDMLNANNIALTRFGQGGPEQLETLETFLNTHLQKKQNDE